MKSSVQFIALRYSEEVHSEKYAIRYFRKYIRTKFALSRPESNWVEQQAFGYPETSKVRKWLKQKGGTASRDAEQALEETRQVIDSERGRVSFVYYCADGHGRIKIGVTGRIEQRLKDFRVYGNPNMLASEPGRSELEKRRHEQFKNERLRGEWFEESDRLAEWTGFVAACQKLCESLTR